MRFSGFISIVRASIMLSSVIFALAGAGVAQDSNFPTGPQYLMNYGSPMFLHSIATPSLSLSTPPPSVSSSATEAVVASEASSAPLAFQSPAPLGRIYWGEPSKDEAGSETVSSEVNSGANLIEISGAEAPSNLPTSIVNVGVEETVDARALRQRGYGVTVAEAASFWKSHKPHAPRLYTNRDIDRVHGS